MSITWIHSNGRKLRSQKTKWNTCMPCGVLSVVRLQDYYFLYEIWRGNSLVVMGLMVVWSSFHTYAMCVLTAQRIHYYVFTIVRNTKFNMNSRPSEKTKAIEEEEKNPRSTQCMRDAKCEMRNARIGVRR